MMYDHLQKGRVLSDDKGGAVKDVVLTGLHSLTDRERHHLLSTMRPSSISNAGRASHRSAVTEQAKFMSYTTGSRIETNTPVETPMVNLTENKF
jgi:hypothetical protein